MQKRVIRIKAEQDGNTLDVEVRLTSQHLAGFEVERVVRAVIHKVVSDLPGLPYVVLSAADVSRKNR